MATPLDHGRDPHTQELSERIAWLIRLRWVAATGVAVTVWAAPRVLGIHLAQGPLYAITAALVAYNAALWAMARWLPAATQGVGLFLFANLQISADLVLLTALLHFSGGIENPFVSYYVFHIVIASILLSRAATYCQCLLAIGLLTAMAVGEAGRWLPHYHLNALVTEEICHDRLYVFARLFVIATTLLFTAFMASSITARLRRREAEIARLSDSLRERANELQAAYDGLQKLERDKSEYMHRVAHDLRSPLVAIDGLLAVIAEGRTGAIPDQALDFVGRSRRRIRLLLDLSSDLLTLARAREAGPARHAQGVDLAEAAAAAIAEFSEQAQAGGVTVQLSAASEAVRAYGDRESISELLENLISNAVKYTPRGGGVRVEVAAGDDAAEITVADSGIGIAADEREKIFTDFYRAANARETGQAGTGLGMSIVKAVVAAHGGTLHLDSELGVGTTVRVTLPATWRNRNAV